MFVPSRLGNTGGASVPELYAGPCGQRPDGDTGNWADDFQTGSVADRTADVERPGDQSGDSLGVHDPKSAGSTELGVLAGCSHVGPRLPGTMSGSAAPG